MFKLCILGNDLFKIPDVRRTQEKRVMNVKDPLATNKKYIAAVSNTRENCHTYVFFCCF